MIDIDKQGSVHSADSRKANQNQNQPTPQTPVQTPSIHTPIPPPQAFIPVLPQNTLNQFQTQFHLKQQYIPPTQPPMSSSQPQPVYCNLLQSSQENLSQTTKNNLSWCLSMEPFLGEFGNEKETPKPEAEAFTNEEILDELIDGGMEGAPWSPEQFGMFESKITEESRVPVHVETPQIRGLFDCLIDF